VLTTTTHESTTNDGHPRYVFGACACELNFQEEKKKYLKKKKKNFAERRRRRRGNSHAPVALTLFARASSYYRSEKEVAHFQTRTKDTRTHTHTHALALAHFHSSLSF